MKTNKTNQPHRTPFYRRPIIVGAIFAAVIVIVAIIVVAAINMRHTSENEFTSGEDSTSGLQATAQEGKTTKEAIVDDGWESKATQYEGENPNQYSELSGSVSFTNVDREAGILTISAMLDQFLNASGTCNLSLRQGRKELYTASVESFADVTTSVCQNFQVPLADLPPGNYTIIITLAGDGKEGIIESEVVL